MDVATYACRSREELRIEAKKLISRFGDLRNEGLKLDMSRGKPSKLQLDLVSDMLTILTDPEECMINGNDARNYGDLAGLKCCREYWADVLGCKPTEIFVGGNASLHLMHDLIARAYTHGLKESVRPWCREARIKFLCPSPGYDRHFRITEHFGFELITIPMTPDGPDMDLIEDMVRFCIQYVEDNCPEELKFFNSFVEVIKTICIIKCIVAHIKFLLFQIFA